MNLGPVVWSSGRPVVLLFLAAAVAAAAAAAELTITIRPEAQVAATVATLADVAELAGDPAAVARLGALPVQDLFGSGRFLIDEGRIRAAIGMAAQGTILTISGRGTVGAPVRIFAVENLAEAARATLVAGGDDVEAGLLRTSGALVVNDLGVAAKLVAEPLDRTQVAGEMPFRVRAVLGDRELGRALITLSVRRYRIVPVAVVALKTGQRIGPTDVRAERRELIRTTQNAAATPEACLGLLPARDIAAGEVLIAALLAVPFAVEAGHPVTLVWRREGIELASSATSLASARLGDVIQVRRSGDQQLVRAQVVGDDMVLLNF